MNTITQQRYEVTIITPDKQHTVYIAAGVWIEAVLRAFDVCGLARHGVKGLSDREGNVITYHHNGAIL